MQMFIPTQSKQHIAVLKQGELNVARRYPAEKGVKTQLMQLAHSHKQMPARTILMAAFRQSLMKGNTVLYLLLLCLPLPLAVPDWCLIVSMGLVRLSTAFLVVLLGDVIPPRCCIWICRTLLRALGGMLSNPGAGALSLTASPRVGPTLLTSQEGQRVRLLLLLIGFVPPVMR